MWNTYPQGLWKCGNVDNFLDVKGVQIDPGKNPSWSSTEGKRPNIQKSKYWQCPLSDVYKIRQFRPKNWSISLHQWCILIGNKKPPISGRYVKPSPWVRGI